jgi:hypothetical protein
MVGNRERNMFIRVSKLNERDHGNVSGPAGPGFEVGTDGIDAQVIVGGVLQIAEAIIGHDQEGSGAVVEHGGEALHRLFIEKRNSLAVDRRAVQLRSRCRTWRKGGRV